MEIKKRIREILGEHLILDEDDDKIEAVVEALARLTAECCAETLMSEKPQLTKKARQQAMIDLEQRLIKAIEESAIGLTNAEMLHCIVSATAVTGVAR